MRWMLEEIARREERMGKRIKKGYGKILCDVAVLSRAPPAILSGRGPNGRARSQIARTISNSPERRANFCISCPR